MNNKAIISAINLTKEYYVGEVTTLAIRNISLDINEGDYVAITGKSGSGKSTLLYQLSLLDNPTNGQVYINGETTDVWSNKKRTQTRLNSFGYVFQDYALVPELNAVENVIMPLYMTGIKYRKCEELAGSILSDVGLSSRLLHRPSQLSGGEQQRVSIARALVNSPRVLFADEPTANLDSETSGKIMKLLDKLHVEKKLTIVMVTHEKEYTEKAKRIIKLKDGEVV